MLTKALLLIGGTGTLGAAFRQHLDYSGIDYRFTSNGASQADPKWIALPDKITSAWLSKYGAICYFAQSRKYKSFPNGISEILEVNTLLPISLARFSREGNIPFVYASSGSVYDVSTEFLSEDTFSLKSPGTWDPYIASKIFAETEIRVLNPESIILRPFFIFGPAAKKPALFPSLITLIASGAEVALPEDVGLIFNPISADIAAQQILFLLSQKQNGVFNLAGTEILTLAWVCNTISYFLDMPLKYTTQGTKSTVIGDVQKITNLGFKPINQQKTALTSYLALACKIELSQSGL